MDYDVPSVDRLLEEGLNEGGGHYSGRYAAAKAIGGLWAHWAVLDARAVEAVQEAIDYLQQLQAAMAQVLDDHGEYDFSDKKSTVRKLEWMADNATEANLWASHLKAKGAEIIKVEPDGDDSAKVRVLFSLETRRAEAILGYEPDEGEWLKE